MAVNRLGRLGRLSGIWLDMATRSQNQGMLGHPGAIRMILLHGESYNFTTLPNMADGGKVYAFRSYHGRLSASTAVARGSGTGDTNRSHLLHFEWKTSGRRKLVCYHVQPDWNVSGFRVTCSLVHQVKILHIRAQSGPDLMPPSLFMYDTTVVLSIATSTILFEQRSWNSVKARTAFSSR